MKTFKWTVPSKDRTDPLSMDRPEYVHWSRVRARGFEWFVVQKGLLCLAVIPTLSAATGSDAFQPQILIFSWFGGLCAATLVWCRRELRFARARDEGMRTAGDDALD